MKIVFLNERRSFCAHTDTHGPSAALLASMIGIAITLARARVTRTLDEYISNSMSKRRSAVIDQGRALGDFLLVMIVVVGVVMSSAFLDVYVKGLLHFGPVFVAIDYRTWETSVEEFGNNLYARYTSEEAPN